MSQIAGKCRLHHTFLPKVREPSDCLFEVPRYGVGVSSLPDTRTLAHRLPKFLPIIYLVFQNQSRLASETWHAVSVLGILVPRIDLQILAETHSEDQVFQASTLFFHDPVAWQSRFTTLSD